MSLGVSFSGALRTAQNVGAYGILWFFPMILMLDKRHNVQKVILGVCVFLALLLILKRGAIIAFTFGFILSVYFYFLIEKGFLAK